MSAGVSGSGAGDGARAADFDQRGAYLTFDALEKVIVQSVASGELDVAAEYVDQLFLLADQLDEYHEEYRAEADRLASHDAAIEREEESVERAISIVASWARKTDHPAREWFNGGGSA